MVIEGVEGMVAALLDKPAGISGHVMPPIGIFYRLLRPFVLIVEDDKSV